MQDGFRKLARPEDPYLYLTSNARFLPIGSSCTKASENVYAVRLFQDQVAFLPSLKAITNGDVPSNSIFREYDDMNGFPQSLQSTEIHRRVCVCLMYLPRYD